MQPFFSFRRRRDFGDVINATVGFLRQNLVPLARSLFYIVAPVWVFVAVAGAFLQLRLFNMDLANPEDVDMSSLGMEYLVVMLFAVLAFTLELLVVYGYMQCYDRNGGPEGIGVDDVWAAVKAAFLRIFSSALFFMSLAFLSTTFILVPGLGAIVFLAGLVFFGTLFSLAYPLMVEVPLRLFDALGRVHKLLRGHWRQTLAVLALAWFMALVLGFLFNLPAVILGYGTNTDLTTLDGSARLGIAAASVVGGLGSIFVYPIPLVAAALQYYNLELAAGSKQTPQQ